MEDAEGQQPERAPKIDIGDFDGTVPGRRADGEDNRTGAEQQFEQTALGSVEEDENIPIGPLIGRAPSERARVSRR